MTDMSRFSRSGHGPGPACCGRRRRHVACNSGPDDEVATMRARAAGDGGCGLWRRHARLEREGGRFRDRNRRNRRPVRLGRSSGWTGNGVRGRRRKGPRRDTLSTSLRVLRPCGRSRRGRFAGLRIRLRSRLRRSLSSVLPGRARRSARGRAHLPNPECLGFEVAGERAFGCGPGPYQEWCVTSDIYRGDVAEGGGCTSNIAGYFSDCQKGLMCAAVESYSGVCLPFSGQDGPQRQYVQVEMGEPCDLYAQCKLGAFCSPDTHTCVPGLSVGADCHGGVCAVGSYCKSFTCTPLLSEGAPCEILSCGAGTYCPFWEQDASLRICTRSQADGEACTRGGLSCASGWCAGVCAPSPPNVCLWWVPEQG